MSKTSAQVSRQADSSMIGRSDDGEAQVIATAMKTAIR
jgi:hypothetical protein